MDATAINEGRGPEHLSGGTWGDRLVTRLRIRQARPYILPGSRVLDVGCRTGELFRSAADVISTGIGVDPLVSDSELGPFRFVRGYYPIDFDESEAFDAVVALAVLEHVPMDQQPDFADACIRHLRPNGRVIITVPSRAVDPIIHVLQRLRLAEGQSLDQHYGFNPALTRPLFESAGFTLMTHHRFELGLNNLYVFVKPDPSVPGRR